MPRIAPTTVLEFKVARSPVMSSAYDSSSPNLGYADPPCLTVIVMTADVPTGTAPSGSLIPLRPSSRCCRRRTAACSRASVYSLVVIANEPSSFSFPGWTCTNAGKGMTLIVDGATVPDWPAAKAKRGISNIGMRMRIRMIVCSQRCAAGIEPTGSATVARR